MDRQGRWVLDESDYTETAYVWEIVLPGSLVGLIVGFATQKYEGARKRRMA